MHKLSLLATKSVAWLPLRWRRVLWRTGKEVLDDRLGTVAAGLAFYLMLAIFPALGAFVSLYGLIADVGDAQDQVRQLIGVFPREVIALLGEAMVRLAGAHQAKLSLAFIFSLVLSVWSARTGMSALLDALNIAYDEPERRSYLRRAMLSYAGAGGVILYAASVGLILAGVPFVLDLIGLGRLVAFWAPLRWFSAYLLTVAAFAIAYRYGPSRPRPSWRHIAPGAFLAAGLWLVSSAGLSFYFNRLAPYDAAYGPLGGVIAFMVWLWASALVFLLGAELNAEIERCEPDT